MNRDVLIRTAEALEDLMTETAFRQTIEERALWWACVPLWCGIQKLLREWREPA